METPPNEGRRTRSALSEIPSRLGQLSVNETTVQSPGYPLPPTPAASPDELIIMQRGRRVPAVWSPDSKAPRTPRKDVPAPRGTPRKRLILDASALASPVKSPKRARVDAGKLYQGSLRDALLGLSHEQVVSVVTQMLTASGQQAEVLLDSLPAPDVGPAIARLAELTRNVFKSLPASRLTSRTDSPAYARAATHLSTLKRSLLESGRTLVKAQCPWAVAQFALSAWDQVRATPVWDNEPHNATRRQCFKALAAWIMHALRRHRFAPLELRAMLTRLEDFSKDNEDVVACIRYIEALPPQ